MAKKKQKKEPEKKLNEPTIRTKMIDDDIYELVLCSNNGRDKGETLFYARESGMKRPILFQINSPNVKRYEHPNFAVTVDEAEKIKETLDRMLDYLDN